MILAAMQPYFFPYLGYFGLIKHSHRFIINDENQYIMGGWIERNRILRPNEGWQYIKVPLVKHSHKALIKDVKIRVHERWKDRILSQLGHYKKGAPYYRQVMEFLEKAFSFESEDIARLDAHLLDETCQYLGIPFKKEILSEMDVVIEAPKAPDEWALNICKAIGADTYINPPGGMEFYDRSKYINAGLTLQFLNVNLRPYDQKRRKYEEGLSIIDVMMFNEPEKIRGMLDDYELMS